MDRRELLNVLGWFSPAFPTGGFAYSGGLESAAADGLVTNRTTLREWALAQLGHGSLRNDAILFAEAWRQARMDEPARDAADLGAALAASAERHAETLAQGAAFADACAIWTGRDLTASRRNEPYCIAAGAACGIAGIDLTSSLAAYLQAQVSNMLQIAIRLSLMGQSGALQTLSELAPEIGELAGWAAGSTLDDLGGCSFVVDIASMNHETLPSRIFLS